MQKRIGGFLGEISLAAPRSSFPLGFHHSARIVDTRLALVGDAGHGIHPVAGQGLNLGFRDVAALTEVLVEGMRIGLDPGDPQVLKRYDRWRRSEEHTSELQSLMRISYAVFCLKKKKKKQNYKLT